MSSKKDMAKALKALADKKRNGQKTDVDKRKEARRKAIAHDENQRNKKAKKGYELIKKGSEDDLTYDRDVLNYLIDENLLAMAKTVKAGRASKWPIIGVKKQEQELDVAGSELTTNF